MYTVDWSPDGEKVASGGKDRVLKLWMNWWPVAARDSSLHTYAYKYQGKKAPVGVMEHCVPWMIYALANYCSDDILKVFIEIVYVLMLVYLCMHNRNQNDFVREAAERCNNHLGPVLHSFSSSFRNFFLCFAKQDKMKLPKWNF